MLTEDVGSKVEKKVLLTGECHQPPPLTALITVHQHLFPSLHSLEPKVHKGKPLDCLVHDCSNIGCMSVALVFWGLVVGCGEEGLFSYSWAFPLEAKLCCNNYSHLKLCGI